MTVRQRKAEIENEFAALQQIFTSGTFSVFCWSAALTSRVALTSRKRAAAACAVRTTEDVPTVYEEASLPGRLAGSCCFTRFRNELPNEPRRNFNGGNRLSENVLVHRRVRPKKISFHVDYLISRREEQRSYVQRLRLGR